MSITENIWIIVAALFWSFPFAVLNRIIEQNAGMETGENKIGRILEQFVWAVAISFIAKKKFGLDVENNKYRVLIIFVYVFVMLILGLVVRALLISTVGR
jgi:hypothetical protein